MMSALQNSQSRPPEATPPSRAALWRNHDYLLLWAGQAVSSVGNQISQLTFPLLVLAVTGSAAQAGLVAAARGIPFVVLTLPAGALIDRWDRKRLMIWCDAGRALALASIPVAMAIGLLGAVQLAAVALVEGTLFTFFTVAETAALPRVVERDQVPLAVSQNQATESFSTLIGPGLGGALYGVGHAVPFLFDAVSYLASVVSLFTIKREFQEEREKTPIRLWLEICEGMAWLWQQKVMRFLALLTGTLMTFSFGYPLFLIVRAQSMHATSLQIGLMFASGGIGGIAGALSVAPLVRRFTVGQIMIGITWVWVLTWPPYAIAPNLLTLAGANVLGWYCLPIFMGTQYSYRLTLIPDALQGRVNSVYKLVAFGGEPIGLALAGALIQLYGAVDAVLIITAPQVVIAMVATLYVPLRRTDHLHATR